MQPAQVWFWVALAALATAVSALFAASEVTVVKTRRQRLETLIRSGLDRVEAALKVDREISRGILFARVGGLLAAVLGGWAAAVGIVPAVRDALGAAPRTASDVLIGVLSFFVVGVFLAVCGQMLPRSLAGSRPESDPAKPAAAHLRIAGSLLWPVAATAAWLTDALRRLLPSAGEGSGKLAEDELNLILLSSYRRGSAGGAQRELIGRVFGYSEDFVRNVMTPKSDMACVASSMRVREALEVVRQFGFTRFPVCEGGKDRVIGTIHIRDLIDAVDADNRQPVTDAMRPAVSLAPNLPLSEALATMQQNRAHMAIVADDTGSALGLVTMEDILSHMVSEPETSPEIAAEIRATGNGVYEFGGDLMVEEIEDTLDIDLDRAGVESIGAFLFAKFGRKPKEGDSIKISGIVFDVLEVRGARIRRLRAQRSREAVPGARNGDG